MVSGDGDYQQSPFNLATMGYRQPGSSFKIFTLAAALSEGRITPYTEFDSKPLTIHFVKQGGNAFAAANGTGRFPVHNFGNVYSGWIPMTVATATSDNSVFAQLGTDPAIGTAAVASYAQPDGHPLADLHQPVDDPRRPQPRRLRAGHGPRLLDRRQRRRQDLQPGPGRRRQAARSASTRSPAAPRRLPHGSTITNTGHDGPTSARALADGRRDDHRAAARPGRRQLRHRHRRRDPRRRRRRQDRHHLQLHRRLVRRLDPADDGRGLGRLPEQRQADDRPTTTASRSRAAPSRRSSGTTSWSARCRSCRTRPQHKQTQHDHRAVLDLHRRHRHDHDGTTTTTTATRPRHRRHDADRRRPRRRPTATATPARHSAAGASARRTRPRRCRRPASTPPPPRRRTPRRRPATAAAGL